MRAPLLSLFGLCTALVAFAAAPAPVSAQQGTLTGRVVDVETGQMLSSAQVQVLGVDEQQAGGLLTDAQGAFRVQLPPGRYSIVATLIGYRQARVDGVEVTTGQPTEVQIEMTSTALELNPVVVTASRRQEKALESPSTIVTISNDRVEERVALSPVEHVKALPGVDVNQTGLTQSNVVTRGFNNVFSGAMLVMTDNRYASVPSLRFNAYNMIPTTQFDVERMEVLLGPAAALYGPNSANGVLHIITTSPIDDPGTKVAVSTGERGVFQTQLRTAFQLSEKAGVKFSGQYMQGDDWEYFDPAEQRAAEDDPGTPLIGARDFAAERYGGELRFDYRPWDDGEVIFNAGHNNLGSSIELTGVGAGQARDWGYSYLQARLTKGRLFTQAFLNKSDAGESFLLRTGQPLIDQSTMMVGQVQHGFSVGDYQEFTYGVDLQRTEPKTGGSITGRNEDDDIINEVGGYLHSETALSEKVDFLAALRVDHHNRLADLVFSPRAAVVFKPAENQNFRVTFNRAFSTPTTNNLFLDLRAATIPITTGIGYDVRTLGVPESGFTFTDRCTGGLMDYCMQTPFAEGRLPANASLLWDGLVQNFVPAALQPLLTGPEAGDLGTVFRRFNQEEATFLPDQGPVEINRIQPTISNTFEVGYKGVIGGKLLLAADVYSNRLQDFVGPLRVETPSVFFDPATVQAFVLERLGPAIQGGQVTQEQAEEIISTVAMLPVGTVAPDQSASSDLILTYRNFGDVDLWGADLSFQYLANDRWSLTGSYAHVSEECFDFDEDGSCTSANDISLNAPANKGSLGARFDDRVTGLTLEGRMRYSEGFSMNSGVYIGDIDAYTSFDANVSYQLPWATGATVTVTGTNIFDNVHRESIGAPEIGRLLMVRLAYEF